MEAAEVIARASYAHEPVLVGVGVYRSWDEVHPWFRENETDRADAILAALRDAGYTIVPTASIVNGIAQLAHVRGQVEGGYSDEVVETVGNEEARMLGWIEAAEHREER